MLCGVLLCVPQGAGTIAHLVHHFYPQRSMHGWELDPAVVAVAQQHMGLQALQDAGCLVSGVGLPPRQQLPTRGYYFALMQSCTVDKAAPQARPSPFPLSSSRTHHPAAASKLMVAARCLSL